MKNKRATSFPSVNIGEKEVYLVNLMSIQSFKFFPGEIYATRKIPIIYKLLKRIATNVNEALTRW